MSTDPRENRTGTLRPVVTLFFFFSFLYCRFTGTHPVVFFRRRRPFVFQLSLFVYFRRGRRSLRRRDQPAAGDYGQQEQNDRRDVCPSAARLQRENRKTDE